MKKVVKKLLVKIFKNLYNKRKKHVYWVMVTIKTFLHLSHHCSKHPMKKTTHDIKFVWVKLTMMIVINVQMPSIYKTMLTYQQENWREGGGRMWVYFHKTWNFTSIAMDAKTSRTTSWNAIFSPPWAHQKRWIPKEFNGIEQESKDGGGLTWFTMQKKKTFEAK